MRKSIEVFFLTAALAVGPLLPVSANTDSRNWTFASGTNLTAILESYSPENDAVILQLGEDGEKREYRLKDFSAVDQAWLTEWAQIAKELEVVLKTRTGTFEHYQAQGQYTTDFYVYYPSKFNKGAKLPMFIMFHSSGKGARYNKKFIEAAEVMDIIIVTLDTFRNTTDEKVDAELLARFRELLPKIEETVPHDPTKLFLGGSSGGAMTAYGYSAEVKRPWAGIFANGGWLGGEKKHFDKPYPAGMRIAMVNGNNDVAANTWVDNDRKILTEKGSTVEVFSFLGAHQVPPPLTQMKAFLWLLNKNEPALPEKTE